MSNSTWYIFIRTAEPESSLQFDNSSKLHINHGHILFYLVAF